MLRLIAFFFGGLVLANVVIVAFETARSAVANKQVSAGAEQKPSGIKAAAAAAAGPGAANAAEPKTISKADAEVSRRIDWVYNERFNAYAETRGPNYPQWLRVQ